MKIYRKLSVLSLIALTSAAFVGCGDKNNEPGPNPGANGEGSEIGIRTEVKLNQKTAFIKELANGHEMNVWMEVTGSTGAVEASYDVHAVNNNGQWTLSPTVKIVKGQTADIYAFYPYSASNKDRKAVPVDATTQIDYLYSGSAVYASATSNVATLNMRHAMTMISFNIKKEGYSGEGLMTDVKISGAGVVPSKGTIDVTNGRVTATEYGPVSAKVNAVVGADGISGVLPGLWSIPFSTKDKDPVTVTLTIDGKEYSAVLPETVMTNGWQYAFRGVLTNNGLAFIPGSIEEFQLDFSDDEIAPTEGYGAIKFAFTGSVFNYPVFTGDNVFGNIASSNGKSCNYTAGGSLDLGASGSQTITVETWNSTGFEIHGFEGIDEIDLSNY